MRMCATKNCRRKARAGRRRCTTCTKRLWRERHPISYLYDNLRTHARERGKDFTLTLEQFSAFCADTGYHLTKGRHDSASTVDRIRSDLGYEDGNIRVLTHRENSQRQDTPPNRHDLSQGVVYGEHDHPFRAA